MSAEDRPVLAGELALGVLDGDERAEALRLVMADRAFAGRVEWWRDRFAAWFAEWPEARPDPALEARVMAALPGGAGGSGGGAANDDARRSVKLWRGVAGASTAAAAALLAALLLQPERVARPQPPAPAPRVAAPAPLIAVLAPTGRGAPIAALVDLGAGTIRLAAAPPVPAGRQAELWTIGTDGVPRSLGVLGGGPAPRLAVPGQARARLLTGVTLAMSIEPEGGSRTGSPTGPVIGTGELRAV